MKQLRKLRAERGSITVEACIVVPILLLTITALIYIGLILYQRSMLQSLAEMTVSRGAASWNWENADIATGKVYKDDLDKGRLYRRLWDAKASDRLDGISTYGRTAGSRQTLIQPVERKIETRIIDYILYKKLEVTVEDRYVKPGGRLLRVFGLDEHYVIRVKASARMEDSTELIRNTDFFIDMERELEMKYPGLGNLGEKTRGVVKAIKEKLDGFLE